MNTSILARVSLVPLALVVAAAACSAPVPAAVAVKRTELAKNIIFEKTGEQRRVVVKGTVCLREGQLEGLLTRKGTKEHEYILTADVDAAKIHAALVAAGAKPGAPVSFQPRYQPARGSAIKISLRYEKDGKAVEISARQWVRSVKDKKDLDQDWVFGGSRLVNDPDDDKKPPLYLANQGDLICLCNLETAMLDLPVRSTKNFEERIYTANTERIPPLGTAVEIVFEPLPEK